MKHAKGIEALEILLQGDVLEGGERYYRFNKKNQQVEYSEDTHVWSNASISINEFLNWDKWNIVSHQKESFVIRKGKHQIVDGEEMPDITPVTVYVDSPTVPEAKQLTKEDVWGAWSKDHTKKLHDGMIVARYNETCPIFGDVVPYKSVTVVCDRDQVQEVTYWLQHVHGSECISRLEDIEGRKVAIRSDYQAW